MITRWSIAAVALLLVSGWPASLPSVDAAPSDGITLPTKPVESDPLPEPLPPEVISEISIGEVYVVTAKFPVIVASVPAGVVKVSKPTLPITVFAKFAGGGYEYRTFESGPGDVWFVGGVKAGKTTIVVAPVDAVDDSQNVQQVLTVAGVGPRPPPEPEPMPKPRPEPTPEPESDSLLIQIIEDPLNRSPDTAIVLNAMAAWNDLKDKGHDWRIYSPRTTEQAGLDAMRDAQSTPFPAMVIRDKKSGKVLRSVPLPATFDAVKRILSELTSNI